MIIYTANMSQSKKKEIKRPAATRALIAADLKKVAAKLKRVPTFSEYDKYGQWCARTALYIYQMKWNDIIISLGYVPNKVGTPADGKKRIRPKSRLSHGKLARELQRVAAKVGHLPTASEFQRYGKHHVDRYKLRVVEAGKVASWSNVLILFLECSADEAELIELSRTQLLSLVYKLRRENIALKSKSKTT